MLMVKAFYYIFFGIPFIYNLQILNSLKAYKVKLQLKQQPQPLVDGDYPLQFFNIIFYKQPFSLFAKVYMQQERAALFLVLVFKYCVGFFSKISINKIIDVLPKLSSRPILYIDGLVLVLLYTDTLEDILLLKLVALSSYDTRYDISCLT